MSAGPACRRFTAPQAANAVPSAVGIVLALEERSLRRCSIPAAIEFVNGASWNAVERSIAVVDPEKDQTTRQHLCEVHGQ